MSCVPFQVRAKKYVPDKRHDADPASSLPRLPRGTHHTRVPVRERCVGRRSRRRFETSRGGRAIPSNPPSHSTPRATSSPSSQCTSTTTCIAATYSKRFECTRSSHARSSRRAGSGQDASAFRTGHVLHLLLQFKGSRHRSMLSHVRMQRVLSAHSAVSHVSRAGGTHSAHFRVRPFHTLVARFDTPLCLPRIVLCYHCNVSIREEELGDDKASHEKGVVASENGS